MGTSEISSSLERIRKRYLEELKTRTCELVELRAKIDDNVAPPQEVWINIKFLSHKLAGTSATLGFLALGNAASSLDEMMSSRSAIEHERSELLKSVDELLSHMVAAQSAG